ncbi:hypothetical protein AGMMS49983_11090 [Clostridia bacterium]|nr:hypothetical protein AGMMS49983_11090 [Clostridia bacterium]
MCEQKQLEIIEQFVVNKAKMELGSKLDSILLYGSYARGDFDDESDIDIMIIADLPAADADRLEEKLISFTTKLDLEYGVVLSLYVKDRMTFNKWRNTLPFYKNVVREGVSLIA